MSFLSLISRLHIGNKRVCVAVLPDSFSVIRYFQIFSWKHTDDKMFMFKTIYKVKNSLLCNVAYYSCFHLLL